MARSKNYGKGYVFLKDIPQSNIRAGFSLKWNPSESCYTSPDMPWMFTPLIEFPELKQLIREGYVGRQPEDTPTTNKMGRSDA